MTKDIFIDEKNYKRKIGEWDRVRKIFSKDVVKSKHLMRVINAWSLDSEFFNKTLFPNDALIRVYDSEENKVYRVKAAKFKEKGEYYHFKDVVDHKAQLFLRLEHWDIEDRNSDEWKVKNGYL